MARKCREEEIEGILYAQALVGDEAARMEYVRFVQMELCECLPDEAREWMIQYAEQGNELARRCYFSWAMTYGTDEADWEKLEQWCHEMLERAPQDASYMLGELYQTEYAGRFDWEKSAEFFRKSLAAGNAAAGYNLACLYREHEPEAHSAQELRELVEGAVASGSASESEYGLLVLLCDELDAPADVLRYARKCHQLEPDEPLWCKIVARLYAEGHGTRQDYGIAMSYYQKAANLGDPEGMFMLGLMYYEGYGARRNFKRAVDYFQRALAAGEVRANYPLGLCYMAGQGVRPGLSTARKYFEAGVAADNPGCMLGLAECCLEEPVNSAGVARAGELLACATPMLEDDDELLQHAARVQEKLERCQQLPQA